MNKNDFAAPNPPMGWNSYDYYNTEVNEAQVRANAEYMASHLKELGWEYVVVDIQWYAVDAGSQSDKYQYIPFGKVVMDEYSRLLPDPVRFPSAAGGKGFSVLAEYIHSLGLKFGIHIMRGIPRAAAHEHRGLLGTEMTICRRRRCIMIRSCSYMRSGVWTLSSATTSAAKMLSQRTAKLSCCTMRS